MQQVPSCPRTNSMASTDTSMSINDFDDDDDEDDDDDDITDGKGNNFYQLKSHLKGTKKCLRIKLHPTKWKRA